MLVRKRENPNILYSSNEMYYEEYQYSLVAVFKICLFFYFIEKPREKITHSIKNHNCLLRQSMFHSAPTLSSTAVPRVNHETVISTYNLLYFPLIGRNNQEMRWAFSSKSTDTMFKHLYLESRKGYVKYHLIHGGTMFSADILHNG